MNIKIKYLEYKGILNATTGSVYIKDKYHNSIIEAINYIDSIIIENEIFMKFLFE